MSRVFWSSHMVRMDCYYTNGGKWPSLSFGEKGHSFSEIQKWTNIPCSCGINKKGVCIVSLFWANKHDKKASEVGAPPASTYLFMPSSKDIPKLSRHSPSWAYTSAPRLVGLISTDDLGFWFTIVGAFTIYTVVLYINSFSFRGRNCFSHVYEMLYIYAEIAEGQGLIPRGVTRPQQHLVVNFVTRVGQGRVKCGLFFSTPKTNMLPSDGNNTSILRHWRVRLDILSLGSWLKASAWHFYGRKSDCFCIILW